MKDKAKAAYQRLHDLVRRRFRGNPSAEIVLSEYQADPETYAAPLAKKLTQAGIDAELVAVATSLMELVDQAGARSGKYNVTVRTPRVSKSVTATSRSTSSSLLPSQPPS